MRGDLICTFTEVVQVTDDCAAGIRLMVNLEKIFRL